MGKTKSSKRLIILGVVALMLFSAAFAYRTIAGPTLIGKWTSDLHSANEDGSPQTFGDEIPGFTIDFRADGTYEENGNMTDGKWVRVKDTITLTPSLMLGQTKAEHLAKWDKKEKKPPKKRLDWLDYMFRPMSLKVVKDGDELWFYEKGGVYVFNRLK